MLLSSALTRSLLVCCILLTCGCGGAPRYDYASSNESVQAITGKVVVEGSNPFLRDVFIVDDYGIRRLVRSPELENELAALRDHRVTAKGMLRGGPKRGYVFFASSYVLDPPEGEAAFKGEVLEVDGELVLKLDDGGKELPVRGELAEALINFKGCNVWIWGRETEGKDRRDSANGPGIILSGYEVIGF